MSKSNGASLSICGKPRRTIESVTFVLLLLCAISMVARVMDLSPGPIQSQVELSDPVRLFEIQQALLLQRQQEVQARVTQQTRPPHVYDKQDTKKKCYIQRDVGIIPAIRQSAKNFCVNGGWDSEKQQPVSPNQATKVSTFRVGGGIKSATFQNLMLDLIDVKIYSPIANMAQDGGKYDPRFNFNPSLINCACDEFAAYIRNLPNDKERQDLVRLNSWIMLQALGWDVTKTHVINFDGGYPSPIDQLHQGLLSPIHEIIDGSTLLGKRIHFRGDVMIAPYELSGPMMQHLDDKEPCFDSELFKIFRSQALLTLGITPQIERNIGVTAIRLMIVTVITRRPYGGRVLQRVWLNEDEIMDKIRVKYKDLNVEFRSIEYVNLTLAEQMKTTIESDMIISMHGAGLVNVLWARPMTKILEIFPKERFRWGYRNLCHFVGCKWHQFRGGQVVGENPTPNSKIKQIPYGEWMMFFVPIFNSSYDAFQELCMNNQCSCNDLSPSIDFYPYVVHASVVEHYGLGSQTINNVT